MDAERERAEFEAWAATKYLPVARMRSQPNTYVNLSTQDAWDAWQESGRRAAAAPVAPAAGIAQTVDGMFPGESMAAAAESWAGWCERRHYVEGLILFLRKVAAAAPVAVQAETNCPEIPESSVHLAVPSASARPCRQPCACRCGAEPWKDSKGRRCPAEGTRKRVGAMSGGSFNYAYSHVRAFSESLHDKLHDDPPAEAGVEARLRAVQAEAARFAEVMRAVEWYYSCDIGEDTLMARLDAAAPPTKPAVVPERKLRESETRHLNLLLDLQRLMDDQPTLCNFPEVEQLRVRIAGIPVKGDSDADR